jgi:hypothetical protein
MNNDAKFLEGILKDWNVPFDNTDYGRRRGVAKFIKSKNDEIETLKAYIKELENSIKGNYISVSDI